MVGGTVRPPAGFTSATSKRLLAGGPSLFGVQPFAGPPPGASPFRTQLRTGDVSRLVSALPRTPNAPARGRGAGANGRKAAMVAMKQPGR